MNVLLISRRGFLYSATSQGGCGPRAFIIVRDNIIATGGGVFDSLTRQVIVQLTIKTKVGKKIIGYYFSDF